MPDAEQSDGTYSVGDEIEVGYAPGSEKLLYRKAKIAAIFKNDYVRVDEGGLYFTCHKKYIRHPQNVA